MDFWGNTELDGHFAVYGHVTTLRGRLALTLIEKWGTVAGKIADKEDSAGRAVLDVMLPAQVVERAFVLADLAVSELEKRGWVRPVEATPEEFGAKLGRIELAREKKRFERLQERVKAQEPAEAAQQ